MFSFAAVLWPYSDHVHSGLFLITGGFGVGAWHPHILQVIMIFLFKPILRNRVEFKETIPVDLYKSIKQRREGNNDI